MNTKLCVAAGAAAVTFLLGAASPAPAFTHEVGATGVGALRPMAFGSLTTCDDMAFTGHVTSNDRTYGDLGGTFQIDQASFERCDGGVRVTAHLPLGFSVDPVGGYGVGLDVDITTASGTCRYSGTLWGAGGFGAANVGGDLYRRTAGCAGPSQFAVRSNLSYTAADGSEL